MKENKTKPDIRFKGFTEAWEQRKLRELLAFLKDGTHGTHADADDGPLLLSAKNIKNGEIYWDETDRKISYDEYEKIHSNFSLESGDVLLTIVGSIGETAILKDSEGVTFQRSVAFLRPNNKITSDFLYSEIQVPTFQKELDSRKSTSAQPGIYLGDLAEIPVTFTTKIEEQKKIGTYFEQLDNLITLHQRECDHLKELKKSMLKKMFPRDGSSFPEVRFAGFTDAWEQRKLGEIVGIYDGVHQTPKYQDSGIMFLSVENISTLQSTKYISEEDFKRDYKVYPQENDILMTRIGDVGTTNVVTDNTLKAYYVSLALLKYKNTNPYFLSNAMQSNYVQKGLANRTLKTAVPMKINKDEIGKVDVILTAAVEEQSKIGSYFKNLDNLITLHQRELEILKNLKKTCLKRMFI